MSHTLLPHKLSELAQIAVDDVGSIEERLGVWVEMDNWIRPLSDGGCAVCAAGAVMVCRLGADCTVRIRGIEGMRARFGEHNARALLAIDSLREAKRTSVSRALACLEHGYDGWTGEKASARQCALRLPIQWDSGTPTYASDPDGWHEYMSVLITALKHAEL